MNILWNSDCPFLPTGYAMVSRNLCQRFTKAGLNVNYMSFQNQGMPVSFEMFGEKYNFPLFYQLHHDEFYGNRDSVLFWANQLKPDVVAFLSDSFMLKWIAEKKPNWKQICRPNTKSLFYFPFDSDHVYSGAKEVMEQIDIRVAMAKWGQNVLKKDTGLDSYYIPHGFDPNVFRPLKGKEELKKSAGFENKFIVGMVARNQSRKMIPSLFQSFKEFKKDKEDAILFCHCVSDDTPVIIKDMNNQIDVLPVRDLAEWTRDGGEEVFAFEKGAIKVFGSKGFSDLQIIKRQKRRTLKRVLTGNGLIDCTPDHKLLTNINTPINANDVKVGDSLLHKDFPENTSTIILDPELAWVMGLFVAEGTCHRYTSSGWQWKIDNTDKSLLERAKKSLEKFFDCEFYLREYESEIYTQKKIYRLTCSNEVLLGNWFSSCYTKSNHGRKQISEKKVPKVIFNADQYSKLGFIEGYVAGDGNIPNETSFSIKTNSKTLAMGVSLLVCQGENWKFNINTEERKYDSNQYIRSYYGINFSANGWKDGQKIKKIVNLPEVETYVYDLTTESHDFMAGVGRMVVHNCDPLDPQGWNLLDYCNMEGLTIGKDVFFGLQRYSLGIPEPRVNMIYNMFDVHVLPTTGEGFGLPIIESMACGIPNIATDYTSCRELIEGHGELVPVNGYIIGQLNTRRALPSIPDMTESMNKLYYNKELRDKYSRDSIEFVKDFTWDNVVRMWLELFEKEL